MKNYIGVLLLALALLTAGCSKEIKPAETEKGIVMSSTSAVPPAETFVIDIDDEEEEETSQTDFIEEQPEEIIDDGARAVISFVGDVTQSDVFGDATSFRGISYPLEQVAPIFESADISFANLETSVSLRGESEKKAGYGFRTDPDKLRVFTEAGIDIVSLANNHVRDFGMDALSDTFENVEASGMRYVGAGETPEEAAKLEIIEANGIRIGFTACNMFITDSSWYVNDERAGINCIDESNIDEYLEKLREYDKMCDVLIVSAHWGTEYYNGANAEQVEFAHKICDSGADIIFGHHPHVLEPIEKYGDSVIFYSLGNFLFYKMDDNAGKTAVFTIEIDRNGFVSGKMYPVFITNCQSTLVKEQNEMYREIIDLVDRISEEYGVSVDENGEIIVD